MSCFLNSQNVILRPLCLTLASLLLAQFAAAQTYNHAYVVDVTGEVTLSLPPFIAEVRLASGTVIPMDASLSFGNSDNDRLIIACGLDASHHRVSSKKQLKAACPSPIRKADALRTTRTRTHPIVLFPRQKLVKDIDYIVWGNSTKSRFKIELFEKNATDDTPIVSAVVDKASVQREVSPIYQYNLSKEEHRALRKNKAYFLVITDLNNGNDTRDDKRFSGVFSFASEADWKSVKRELNKVNHASSSYPEGLRAYYSSVLLMNSGYFYEGRRLVSDSDSISGHLLQLQRSMVFLAQGSPVDFTAQEFLTTITQSKQVNDDLTALLACRKLFALERVMTPYLEAKMDKLSENPKFISVCPCFDRETDNC